MIKAILTNDDGIDADGLQTLRKALSEAIDLVVIAPDRQRSECGHSVTTSRPLKTKQHGDQMYSIDGTPVDCVRIGLAELATDAELVISGINHGGNLGADIWMSGTVAAAREGHLRGVPAIAISQYRRQDVPLQWERAAEFAAQVIGELLADPEKKGVWNVNLPATESSLMPSTHHCEVDSMPLPINYRLTPEGYELRGSYHDRPRSTGKDVAMCFGGCITISEL